MKAELEIELLHETIDQLRAQEVLKLTEAVRCLTDLLQRSSNASSPGSGVASRRAPARRAVQRHELFAVEDSDSGVSFALALTREPPKRKSDFGRRLDAAMVADVASRLPAPPGYVFVSGSNAFVDLARRAGDGAGPALRREVVAIRMQTRLPLDDVYVALRPSIPALTRSTLHRYLQRQGVSRLPRTPKQRRGQFAAYGIGYFHLLHVEHRLTKRYHPWTNGQAERVVRTLKQATVRFAETTTFAAAAREIGAPRAVRAGGSACSQNPLEFAIPCHRVLKSDGSYSGGSTWGDIRQSAIVRREAEWVATRSLPNTAARQGWRRRP